MGSQERKQDWLRYLNACTLKQGALLAILENDGPGMLGEVLKELKVGTAMELVLWLKKNGQ